MAMKIKKGIPGLLERYIYACEQDFLDENTKEVLKPLFRDFYVNDYFHGKHKAFGKIVEKTIQAQIMAGEINRSLRGPFPFPKYNYGDMLLGLDPLTGKEIWIPSNDLINVHSIEVGETGAGKTRFAIHKYSQIGDKTAGLWIFDAVKGGEFRALKRFLKRKGIKVYIIKAREMEFNVLQCEQSVNPIDYALRISGLIVLVLEIPPSASKTLQRIILQLYKERGVLDGGDDGCGFPTLFDLYFKVANDSEIHKASKTAILNSLEPVLLSIGSVLKYRKGWEVESLAKQHIIFELGNIPKMEKGLIMNTLIMRLFTSRLANENF